MGIIYQQIRLSNAAKPELEEVDAKALVDSGAMDLCVSPLVAKQLKLDTIEQRTVTVADGRSLKVDYAGPIIVEVFGRRTITGAIVMGDGVLLGAIAMQGMDVLIDPRQEQLIPNPLHPDAPGGPVPYHTVQHND